MEIQMSSFQTLGFNAQLLKAKASGYAVYGVAISIAAVIVATALSGYLQFGYVNFDSLLQAQKSNAVLWFLDITPLFFACWGQYIGSIMSYEAGALLADQMYELRTHNAALENKVNHDATHDSITGLPNRVLFHDRVSQTINLSQRKKSKFAIVLLDLDRFKEINDTLGHFNGDRLLKLVGMRLEMVIRKSDTLSRFGGDEFAILLTGITDEGVVSSIAEKIHQSLKPAFILDDLKLDIQASVGVVIYPEHGEDTDTLIQRADIAMYVAKHAGRDTVTYEAKLDQYSPQRLTLMGELRQAIENDDLTLHYQPQIKASNEHAIGAEVLVRWNHPEHGLIPPDDFIGLAERTGLIEPLTRWVLKHSLQQGSIWHKSGLKIALAVNLSAKSLLNPDFPDILTNLLISADFPKEYLLLEVTETAVMADPELALNILNRIANMGIRISIDDFGTGYSSLAYLKRLPVSELKIDKSFVSDMLTNEDDSAIVHATIDLAHNLGLEVVAEGVEDQATTDKLRSLNCDIYQGYHFSKPVPPKELQAWFQSNRYGYA
ncbi:MAG: EAL domain-containing protein [Gammaproteobacteria bacterium]|nr:EAL domain-containing protein [Gammaproteobacteria bacterium]